MNFKVMLVCRRFVATGQTASKATKGKGTVCVWDAVDCRQLCRMDGCHQRGVNSLAFSPDGSQLVSWPMTILNSFQLVAPRYLWGWMIKIRTPFGKTPEVDGPGRRSKHPSRAIKTRLALGCLSCCFQGMILETLG
jgi:WD40 repeat protein